MVRSVYMYIHTSTCHYDVIDPMTWSDVAWSEHSRFLPPRSFIPLCIYPIFAVSSMQPFKVAFPADISIKPLRDVTSFSIYSPFEMRIFENAKYDFKVRKLHYTCMFSHMTGGRAFVLSDTRFKNRPTEYSI